MKDENDARSAVPLRTCKGECGQTYPLTEEHFLVTKREGDKIWFRGYCRPCFWKRQKELRDATPERAAQARRVKREYEARRRKDPEKRERMREAVRRYRKKVREDERLRKARNEAQRMKVRLQAERGLRPPVRGRVINGTPGPAPNLDARLPALQLARAMDAHIRRKEAGNLWDALPWGMSSLDRSGGLTELCCERAGISPRLLHRWRTGDTQRTTLATADGVLIEMGRHWWDVWNEETVRRPLLRVLHYEVRPRRKSRQLHLRQVSWTDYGDAGPDHEVLAEVREVFEG